MIKEIKIKDEYITLGQFLKFADVISNGGEVKMFLSSNEVLVNNELDIRRGRKLCRGDKVKVLNKEFIIC